MISVKIFQPHENETLQFAAEELCAYLQKLDHRLLPEICPEDRDGDGIRLCLMGDGSSEADITEADITGLSGRLSGSNPRSVLFAVYQYLEAVGVRWVRHGADGEYLPEGHDFSSDRILFRHEAKHLRRAICMEGALRIENSLDNIDWAAKLGFNEYYIQHILPTAFFRAWYEHRWNPNLPEEPFSEEMAAEFKVRMVREIKKRGLVLHDVGHGWHSEPFGFPAEFADYTREQKDVLALIGGERRLFRSSLAATHMCYSRPDVRRKIVDYCVQYAKAHPEMDRIFFPLADGNNNHCECEACSKFRPSDLYVQLLNELDAALTKEGLMPKVVIALYCDYLWPPTQGQLRNPDRFQYVFAPFHRTNAVSYKDLRPRSEPIAPYVRNRNTMPKDVALLIDHLKAWQSWQDIETFTHEYYYYVGEHYLDFGSVYLARIIYDDIRELKNLHMSGMMTCQSQRAFLPTGFGSWVMAKALWDDQVPFEEMRREFFQSAYGPEGKRFEDFSCRLSDLAHDPSMEALDAVAEECAAMEAAIDAMDPASLSPCHRASVRYAKFHCGMLLLQVPAEKRTRLEGAKAAAGEWLALFRYIRTKEPEVQSVFDVFQFLAHVTERYHTELRYLQNTL